MVCFVKTTNLAKNKNRKALKLIFELTTFKYTFHYHTATRKNTILIGIWMFQRPGLQIEIPSYRQDNTEWYSSMSFNVEGSHRTQFYIVVSKDKTCGIWRNSSISIPFPLEPFLLLPRLKPNLTKICNQSQEGNEGSRRSWGLAGKNPRCAKEMSLPCEPSSFLWIQTFPLEGKGQAYETKEVNKKDVTGLEKWKRTRFSEDPEQVFRRSRWMQRE